MRRWTAVSDSRYELPVQEHERLFENEPEGNVELRALQLDMLDAQAEAQGEAAEGATSRAGRKRRAPPRARDEGYAPGLSGKKKRPRAGSS